MKFYLAAIALIITLSSCLKESIADAMLNNKNSGNITATLSYEINGKVVKISVDDADNQNPNFFTLGCIKNAGDYNFNALENTNELNFDFYTDSLTVGNYKYLSRYGDKFFIDNEGINEYIYGPADSLSFNITSVSNGHISGDFSGVLTPLITVSGMNNIYGASSSVLVTNGTFKNVPVFY